MESKNGKNLDFFAISLVTSILLKWDTLTLYCCPLTFIING